MINRGGPSFVVRIADETGAEMAAIAAAFAAVRDSYRMTDLNGEIDALDAKISGKLQIELYAAVQDLLLNRVIWFLRNVDLKGGLADVVAHYRRRVEEMEAGFETILTPEARKVLDAKAAGFTGQGVPGPLARKITRLPLLASATDAALIADRTKQPVEVVARTYFAAREFLQLDTLVKAARELDVQDRFDRLAIDRAIDSMAASERRITAEMLATGKSGQEAVEAWAATRRSEIDSVRSRIQEISGSNFSLSRLSVAASLVGDLVKG